MCLYPQLIENPKYRKNKKNGGVIPPFPIINGVEERRVKYVPIGCDQCYVCRKQKAREWKIRLDQELKSNPDRCVFVTLTLSDESYEKLCGIFPRVDGYERENNVIKRAIKLWAERWRKKNGKQPRRFFVSELGHQGTENVHAHGLVWGNFETLADLGNEVRRHWKYGFIWLSNENNGFVNNQTINYLVKYFTKVDVDHPYFKGAVIASNGLGSGFVKSQNFKQARFNKKGETKEYYVTDEGFKMALPIYYRNLLYNDEERESLWIDKLDLGKRWVNGTMIDMNQEGAENILNDVLEYERKFSEANGYLGNKVDWDKKEYYRQLANMNHETRIKRAREKDALRQGQKGGT